MDEACHEDGPGVDNKSSGEMDTIEWKKKTRLTKNWLDSNCKEGHEEKEPDLAVDRKTWKELTTLCDNGTGGTKY